MEFSAALPKNIQKTQSMSEKFFFFAFSAEVFSFEILISGIGAILKRINETTGASAQKTVRIIQFSLPKRVRNNVLITTTVTTPHA